MSLKPAGPKACGRISRLIAAGWIAHLRRSVFYGNALLGLVMVVLWASASDATAACQLSSAGNKIKHVVHLQFDNLHWRRDNPNVASDIEQMPFLRSFLIDNGVVAGDHHTTLPSDAATNLLTILTGLYSDRMGVPVGDSYGYFRTDASVGFASSFAYWTAPAPDGLPQMLADNGKIAPAPWVAFTRAGCDVGSYGMPAMSLESLPSDVLTVFGSGTPEAIEAAVNPIRAKAELLGVAVHCARDSQLCADPRHARADLLPDEPGGYDNFLALFGNLHVQPMVSPQGPIEDLDGNLIQDAYGNLGFPNLPSRSPAQAFGYAATMLEAGIPIVYASVSDLHTHMESSGPLPNFGPGEPGYHRQLAAADQAFERFIKRLASRGITKDNTLFIIVSDQGGHFVGGLPHPATCNGDHIACSYPDSGVLDASIERLLATQRQNMTTFDIHFDNAPAIYIHGNPSSLDPITRFLEQDFGKLTVANPISGLPDRLMSFLADRATMKFLHMTPDSPARIPSFMAFGAPDYFFITDNQQTGHKAECTQPSCVEKDTAYSWTHGGPGNDMSQSWVAMVGSGVLQRGFDSSVFSDHADIRPTMLALLGLHDDYIHDGRALVEWIEPAALPAGLKGHSQTFPDLARVYKSLNAPLGEAGLYVLAIGSKAIQSNDDTYASFLSVEDELATARNQLVTEIKTQLDAAIFANAEFNDNRSIYLENAARTLLRHISELAGRDPSLSLSLH